jgi:hypothetical protein
MEMRLATVVIALVLGLQFFANISRPNKWGWPFTDYPMYDRSHHEGERIVASPVVVGTTEDGQTVQITPADVDLNIWQFMSWTRALTEAHSPSPNPPRATNARVRSLRPWLKSTGLFDWRKHTDSEALPGVRTGAILAAYQQKFGQRIVHLRVEDNGVIVTRAGMQEVPPQVLAEIDVSTGGQ